MEDPKSQFDYLCVDAFVDSLVGARALSTALELGVIDHLQSRPGLTSDVLNRALGVDGRGLNFLLDLLRAAGVVENDGERLRLTPSFHKALSYRDLLEAKLAFANVALYDFSQLFTPLVADPDQFARKARIFEFFGYNRCVAPGPGAYDLTRRWMRITTALTRYESEALLQHHDFSACRRVLDVGGNSGELALRICRKHPAIHVTVFDLPLVCEIGAAHVRPEPEADRIAFVKGNALQDEFSGDFDLVCFKSVLHDWPATEAFALIAKARRSLRPGGTLLIFERGPITAVKTAGAYSQIPMMLFFRSFRAPEAYAERLGALGFANIRTQAVDLEMRFFLVTGTLSGE